MPADAEPPSRSPLAIARAVAGSATAHDDVIALDGGLAGEFATYGFGGRVAGVRVDLEGDGRAHVRVRIDVRFGRPIPTIGDEVRSHVLTSLRDLGVDGSVHVHVADITEAPAPPDVRALSRGAT